LGFNPLNKGSDLSSHSATTINPAPGADGFFFLSLGFLLRQVTAGIIHPAALKTLLIIAVFVAIAIDIANMAAGAAFDFVHIGSSLCSYSRTG
jgi:hypothetical protein